MLSGNFYEQLNIFLRKWVQFHIIVNIDLFILMNKLVTLDKFHIIKKEDTNEF